VPQLERLDLTPCARGRRAAAIARKTRNLLRQSWDSEKDLPLRALLLKLDADDHALVIKLHHLVTDGWSQRLFWQELETLYSAKVKGIAPKLAALPIQYRHFVERQRAWLLTSAAEKH
jgi:hypothetical protein